MRALSETSSYLLRSRITLDRVRSLDRSGQHGRSEEGDRSRPVSARQEQRELEALSRHAEADAAEGNARRARRPARRAREDRRGAGVRRDPRERHGRVSRDRRHEDQPDVRLLRSGRDGGGRVASGARGEFAREHGLAYRGAQHDDRRGARARGADADRHAHGALQPDREADQRCRRSLRPHLARRSHAVRAHRQDQRNRPPVRGHRTHARQPDVDGRRGASRRGIDRCRRA